MVTLKESGVNGHSRLSSPHELTTAKKRRLRKKKAAARKAEEQDNECKTLGTKVSESRTTVSEKITSPKKKKKGNTNTIDNQYILLKQHKNTSPKDSLCNKDNTVIPICGSVCNKSEVENDNTCKIVNMSSKEITKSREEVLAEREAKKLAKLNTKTKSSSSSNIQSNVSKNIPLSSNQCDVKKVEQNKKLVQNAKKEVSEPKKILNDIKKAQTPPNKVSSPGKDEVDRSATINQSLIEVERSRDHVKAERESKKLAKQLSKKKAGAPETEDAKPSEIVTKITEAKVEHVAGKLKSVKLEESAPGESKSKAEMRAERRAKQEAQRAAKEASSKNAVNKLADKPVTGDKPVPKELAKVTKAVVNKLPEKPKSKTLQSVHKVNWFQHLYTEREEAAALKIGINSKELHPAIVRLGVQLSSRVIVGSNARCIALLNALKQVVTDYALPAKTEFSRGLEAHFATCLQFLWSMRPSTASMTNAVKHLKWHLTQLPNNVNEFDAKSRLHEAIDTYIRDQIEMAGEAISIAVRNKISDGDNILTYGCSSLIEKILKEAWSAGLQYRVVIVGSRSRHNGLEMLRRLTSHGIPCTYINISAISFLMRTINKVLLGAGSLLVNGSVLAHAGTAQVALVAHAYNVPVLVCCETHKFSERVQTDAFVYNEIGNPDHLVDRDDEKSPLKEWRSHGSLTPLNLTYDVTPPGLVTAVVTELAVLPCTSAPVVLRFKLSEYGM